MNSQSGPVITFTTGEANVRITLTDAPSVRNQTDTKTLHPVEAWLLLWLETGRWTISSVHLYGYWENKTGRAGTRKGEIGYSRPIDEDTEAPAWLRNRLAHHLARLNREPPAAVEYGVQLTDDTSQVQDISTDRAETVAYAERLRAAHGPLARVVTRTIGPWTNLHEKEN